VTGGPHGSGEVRGGLPSIVAAIVAAPATLRTPNMVCA
jgi:hypothetical protein